MNPAHTTPDPEISTWMVLDQTHQVVASITGTYTQAVAAFDAAYPSAPKDRTTYHPLLWGDHLWSPSYFAGSCGGAPLEIVKQYIEHQKRP